MEREYRKIYCCGDCVQYDWKKHRCRAGAHVEDTAHESFYRDCPETIYREEQERKTGRWIVVNDAYNRISGKCSACWWEAHLYEDDVVGMDYCPNCGAKMERSGEE